MTNEITITLPEGYTLEQAYKDAAIATGMDVLTKTIDEYEPKELYVSIINRVGFNPDGSGNGSTTYTVKATDAEIQEMGKQVWCSVINERLTSTRLLALQKTVNMVAILS